MFSSSSDSSNNGSDQEESKEIERLGECEVCAANAAKYTCPKCDVKTCCLDCVIIHKKELECDGVRDRTKFIRVKDFTDTDLLSDYRLLEECARFVYGLKRDEKKRFTRIDNMLPFRLMKLKVAANKRGVALQFLAQNFSRHIKNTTRYLPKQNVINWRVEWVFPNVERDALKFVDEQCPDDKRLSELLDKYLNPDAMPFDGSKALALYKSAGYSGVKVLLRAEKVRGSAKKFFELDTTETLADNLCGKCIVEFPIVFVVMKDHAYNFDIVTPEDEFDYDKSETQKHPSNGDPHQSAEDSKKKLENENLSGTISSDESKRIENGPPALWNQNQTHNQLRGNGNSSFTQRPPYQNGLRTENGQHCSNRYQNQRQTHQNSYQSQNVQSSQNGEQIENEHPNQNRNWNQNRKRPQMLTKVILQKKQEEIQKELREAKKKRPKNLLFTTGYSSEESFSDIDE